MNATIDAHQHYWRYDPALDGWIDPAGPIARDFLPDEAWPLLDAAALDAAVAVQARSTEAETRFLLDLARQHPRIAGVVGWLDLTADDLAERIASHRATGPLVGLRHIAQEEPDDFLLRDAVVRGVRTTLAAGLAYDILVYPRQLSVLPAFLDRVGEGRLVLDHGAKPPIAAGGWQPWADGIAAVAAMGDHVFCKLSGLVTEADHARWRADEVARYIDHLLACFGPARLVYGSDWPVCTLAASYGEVHALAREAVARLVPDHVAAIFGGNAARLYALDEEPDVSPSTAQGGRGA